MGSVTGCQLDVTVSRSCRARRTARYGWPRDDHDRPRGTGGKRRKAPTIFDVAERAGVSHQTVSRVINGDPTVRDAFRTQVTDAVHELGYRPRAAARALAGGRSRALGIITAGDALYGPSSTAIGFERAARSAGYHVLLSTLPEDPTPSDLSGALTTLLAQDVAAIVLVAADNRVLDALGSLTVPVTVPVVVSNARQRDAVRPRRRRPSPRSRSTRQRGRRS